MTSGGGVRDDCPACTGGLRHCHGVLIRHADGTLECLAPDGCAEIPDAHDDVYPCEVIVLTCGCTTP